MCSGLFVETTKTNFNIALRVIRSWWFSRNKTETRKVLCCVEQFIDILLNDAESFDDAPNVYIMEFYHSIQKMIWNISYYFYFFIIYFLMCEAVST